VGRGETLSGIARRLLNDETRWIEIFQLNRDRLSSPHRIQEGMVLRIPRGGQKPEDED
jgi:nucleoid-associated protein YgaU